MWVVYLVSEVMGPMTGLDGVQGTGFSSRVFPLVVTLGADQAF
jgi:hypothetical protein